MLKKFFLPTLLLVTSLYSFERASLGLNINNKDVEIEGRTSLEYITAIPEYSNFFLSGNILNSDENLYGLGISVENSVVNYQNILFNIGLKTVFSSHNNQDFAAVPITFGAKAQIFRNYLPYTYLGIKANYAPSALSYKDADDYKEYRIEVDSNVVPNIDVYAGFRRIDTKYNDTGKYRLNSKAYAGFKFVFDPR